MKHWQIGIVLIALACVAATIGDASPDRRVITVTNYHVSPDDPDDFVSVMPGATTEFLVVSHYHHYRVGMESVRQDMPAGSRPEFVGYLPEGDNAEGSTLNVSQAKVLNESTFSVVVDARQTQLGDNYILYFTTVGKSVKDYRWPDWPPTAGTPRSFQIHLHIGPSMDEYIRSLER